MHAPLLGAAAALLIALPLAPRIQGQGAIALAISLIAIAGAISPHYVPERALIGALPVGDRPIVLATAPMRGYIAELAGRGRAVSSHAPTFEAARIAANADASGSRWQALFAASRAQWILMTPTQSSAGLPKALIDARATRIARAGDAELWRLSGRAPCAGLTR
jgi:hypothetical protein